MRPAAGADRARAGTERFTGTKRAAGPKLTADIGRADAACVVTPGMSAWADGTDGAAEGREPAGDEAAAGAAGRFFAGLGWGVWAAGGTPTGRRLGGGDARGLAAARRALLGRTGPGRLRAAGRARLRGRRPRRCRGRCPGRLPDSAPVGFGVAVWVGSGTMVRVGFGVNVRTGAGSGIPVRVGFGLGVRVGCGTPVGFGCGVRVGCGTPVGFGLAVRVGCGVAVRVGWGLVVRVGCGVAAGGLADPLGWAGAVTGPGTPGMAALPDCPAAAPPAARGPGSGPAG